MDHFETNSNNHSPSSIEDTRKLIVATVDGIRSFEDKASMSHPIDILNYAHEGIVEGAGRSSSLDIARDALVKKLSAPNALTVRKSRISKFLRALDSFSGDGASFVNAVDDRLVAWNLADKLMDEPIYDKES